MPNPSVVEHVFRMQDMIGEPGEGTGDVKRDTSKNLAQQLKKLAGIDLGLGALLKQSQIFTGYMGNLFAIIGAMIDTILAPLAPTAFKALAELGKKIPAISKMAEKWMPKLVEYGKEFITTVDTWMKKLSSDWAGKLFTVIKWLIAINLGIRLLTFGGRTANAILGLRGMVGVGRGAVGIGSRIMGGGAATAAATAATRAGAAATTGTIAAGTRVAASGASGLVDASGRAISSKAIADISTKAGATSTASAWGKAARWGRGAGRVTPIVGLVTAGALGYMEGRNRGESVAKAGSRAAFNVGGAGAGMLAGGAIGTMIMPGIGTAIGAGIGGVAGGFGGNMLFDQLFGDKKEQGRFNIGSQTGMAGYRAPLFVGGVGEEHSETVRKLDIVMKDLTISVDDAAGSVETLGAGVTAWGTLMTKIAEENAAYVPPPDPSAAIPELDPQGAETGTPAPRTHWGVDPETGKLKDYGYGPDAEAAAVASHAAWAAFQKTGGEDVGTLEKTFGLDSAMGDDLSLQEKMDIQIKQSAGRSGTMLGAFHDKFTSDKDPHDNLGTQLNPNLDALGNVISQKFVPQFDANQQKVFLEQELAKQARERADQAVIDERNRVAAGGVQDLDLYNQMENTAAMGGDPTHELVQVLRDVNEGGVATAQVSSWELQKLPDVNLTIINTPDSNSTSIPMANVVRQAWENDYWAGRGEGGI